MSQVQPSAKSTNSEVLLPSTSPGLGSPDTPHPNIEKPPLPSTPTDQSPSPPAQESNTQRVNTSIPLSMIQVDDELNGRLSIDPDKVMTLQNSIAQTRLMNPITLHMRGDSYFLIAGRHRLAAVKALGWKEIPAVILECTNDEAAVMRLAENSNRAQLSPVEEARQLAHLVNIDPNGIDGVAVKIGRNPGWILDRIDMIEWPDSLMGHVHNKKISLSAAKILSRITDLEMREIRIDQAATAGINTRTAKMWLIDANSTAYQDSKSSEKCVESRNNSVFTETRVQCFMCSELVRLENTTTERFCSPCLHTMQTAMQNATNNQQQ